MKEITKIISDEQMIGAFGNANFGTTDKREILRNSLLKCACGYYTGHTATHILIELGLVTEKWTLTKKGQEYLWAAYSQGISL